MSSVRLTFLYPHLYRSLRGNDSAVQAVRHFQRAKPRRAAFATASRREQRFVQRHGKAVEPFLGQGESEEDTRVFVPENEKEDVKDNAKDDGQKATPVPQTEESSSPEKVTKRPLSEALSEETQAAARLPGDIWISGDESAMKSASIEGEDSELKPEDTNPDSNPSSTKEVEDNLSALRDGPASEVLHMDPPPDLSIPHLHPPPYVHNFDSYTLVKEVEKGGFTPEQAITSMKAVRVLLSDNLEVAKEGLVSKSDVENESYLFKAACSELRTEIQNARRVRDEKMRQERTLLQHEVDILNQKLTQELLTLKDELQGMFNDRKMAVRMEQRSMESAIQELNYKITVALNSDSKSEVEGLRWVLTRRSVLAIVFMALMVLSSLRYNSYIAHEEEMARKKREKQRREEEEMRKHHRMADGETQTEGGDPTTAAEALAAN